MARLLSLFVSAVLAVALLVWPTTARLPLRFAALGLGLLFALLLAYPASWQLAGLFRPSFLAFMQTYDRRQFNPAHGIQRGRILDRRGEVLAYSEEAEGKVKRRYPYGPAFAHTMCPDRTPCQH